MPVSFTEDDKTKTEPLTQGTAAPSEKTPLTAREERLARAEARPSSIGKMERKSTLGYGQFGFNQRDERKGSLTSEKSKCCYGCFSLGSHEGKVFPEYNSELSAARILFSWTGTVFQLVLKKPFFWFLLIMHIGLEAVDSAGLYDIADVEPAVLAGPTSLLIFFAVFYSGQCYDRFFNYYGHCVGIGSRTMEWVGLVTLHLPRDKNIHWNAVRYILAAAHVQYYVMVTSAAAVIEHDWETMVARRLLTEAEIESVRSYTGYAPFLLVCWALKEVQQAILREGTQGESGRFERVMAYQRFEQVGFELRNHFGQITNLLKQPVPWAYFHLLTLLDIGVLFMIAYGIIGQAQPWVTSCIFSMVALSLMGLRELAVAMADPFGEDVIDFKLEKFLQSSYKNALAHLANEHSPSTAEQAGDNTVSPVKYSAS